MNRGHSRKRIFFTFELFPTKYVDYLCFFLIGIVGGGVHLGPLGTAATNWPTVPAPGDYDDGEKFVE
jgi:hypothetical protein